MHLHLIAPSNEDSTYIKALWAVRAIRKRYDFGLKHKKIAGGDTLDVPFGL